MRSRLAAERISGLQFAARVGMSQNYLATRLRDEKSFTVDDLERMCDQWDIEPDELLARALRDHGENAAASIEAERGDQLTIFDIDRKHSKSQRGTKPDVSIEGHEPPMDAAAHSTGKESAKERMMRQQDEDAERQD